MIVINKVLKEIEDKDIDENGVCIIPKGIEVIEYIENEKIKKIVIPEGVEVIGTDGIYCSNLEQIELPSSLKMIGRISSKKLTLENIKFGNKSFAISYNNSLGNYETTTQYVNGIIVQDLTIQIEKCLNTKDYSSIIPIMKSYDAVCFIINEANQEKLSYLIGKLLSQKDNGIEIGEKLMAMCFKDNKLFTPFIFQYFHFKECENLDLKWIPLIILELHGNLAHSDEKKITLGYKSLIKKNNVMFRKQNLDDISMDDNVLINLNSMFVLCHELQHSRQLAKAKRSEDIFDLLDYIDFNVSKLVSYNNDHDIHPEEISADLGAYNSLIGYIERLLPDSLVEKYKKIIEKIKLGRIEQAHQIDENGNIGVLDYRQRFFKKTLDDTKISDDLRLLLLSLQEKYAQLLNIANSKGIDLYEESLGYYKREKNEEDIHEHKTR